MKIEVMPKEDPLPLAGATISRWSLSLDWQRRMVVVPARDRGSSTSNHCSYYFSTLPKKQMLYFLRFSIVILRKAKKFNPNIMSAIIGNDLNDELINASPKPIQTKTNITANRIIIILLAIHLYGKIRTDEIARKKAPAPIGLPLLQLSSVNGIKKQLSAAYSENRPIEIPINLIATIKQLMILTLLRSSWWL
jgi:hypothetical protein